MKPQEMISRHDPMKCPVCGYMISAAVYVVVHLSSPRVRKGNTVSVPIETEMTHFHVTHRCMGREAGS